MRPTALGPVLRLLAVLQAPLPLLHVWAPAGLAPAARAETERTDAHRSGRLLMWNLRHLTSPSAPSPTRFDSGPSFLQVLAGPRPLISVTAAECWACPLVEIATALTGQVTERMREHHGTVGLDEKRAAAVASVLRLLPKPGSADSRADSDWGALPGFPKVSEACSPGSGRASA